MGKKSPPPAPDYTKAAEIQAQSSRDNTLAQTVANRPDVYTPWGSQTWTRNGDNWTQNISLSPEQQAALNSQLAITSGRSNAAQQLLGQATSAFQTPVDYSNLPPGAQAVYAPQLGQGAPQWGGSASGIDPGGQIVGGFGGHAGRINQWGPQSGPLQSSIDQGQLYGMGGTAGGIRYGLDMGNVGGASAGAASAQEVDLKDQMDRTAGDWRQRGQDAALAFMQPNLDRRQQQLETQLSNMGLTRGSEAWNAELQREQDQRTRDEYQAFGQGRQEAEMLFGQDLAASNFTNQARMSGFQQRATNAGFQNQANMMNAQLQQQANFQGAQNRLMEANFWNQAQAQDFSQGMQRAGFMNNVQAQDFNQQMQQAGLGNQAQQQRYGQDLSTANFQNQAQAQRFGQLQAQAQFGNQAQQQQFTQNAAQAAMFNQSRQQDFDNLMRQAQYGDQQAITQMNAQMQAGGFNQQIRQQQLAEQLAQRAQPLNELNALLTGQQVGMPQMPTFNTANRADTTQYMQAAQNQYQAGMDAFNAQQQQSQGMMSGLFGLGGNAMQAGGWGSLFTMSDRRLKLNIKVLFTLPNGVEVCSYRFKGNDSYELGVIAQQVMKVMPEAVRQDEGGIYRVNYNMVLA